MTEKEIKPCPFCGNPPRQERTKDGGGELRCATCSYTWIRPWSDWNRRAESPDLKACIGPTAQAMIHQIGLLGHSGSATFEVFGLKALARNAEELMSETGRLTAEIETLQRELNEREDVHAMSCVKCEAEIGRLSTTNAEMEAELKSARDDAQGMTDLWREALKETK